MEPEDELHIVARSRVNVDGAMTEARLLELIALDEEEDALDFKRTYDLTIRKDLVECVKTLVCMANTGGGYVVLGVEKSVGGPSRHTVIGCPEEHLPALEVTRFNDQIERFVEEPLGAIVAVHRPSVHDGLPLSLMWVPPARTLPLTFRIDGQYEIVDGKGKKELVTAFAPGQIWVRRGARCVQANARDWRRLHSDMRRLERDQWAEDLLGVTPLVQRLDRLASILERWLETGGGQTPPHGPSAQGLGVVDYVLPPRQLLERIDSLYQAEQSVRVQRFVSAAPAQFYRAVESLETGTPEDLERGKDNHLRATLDAVAAAGIVAAEFGDDLTVKASHEAFWRIYERAHRITFPAVAGVDLDAEWVWGEVIKRVYLLGAALLDLKRYIPMADLIEQPIDWDSSWDSRLWARHALTMVSRAKRLERRGLVSEVLEELKREPAFLTPFGGDVDRATNNLCQFDFVQCIHAVQQRSDYRSAYPSFAWYYKQRTEPIVRALINDPNVRRDAIPQMDDERLAAILISLDQVATREAFISAGWSGSWSDPLIQRFLAKHAPKDPKEI